MTKFVGQVTKFVTKGKGTYCLIFSVEGVTFRTGGGREFAVPAGNYIYVGSAFGSGGLRARVGRHLKRGKRPHWHIDYLTTKVPVSAMTAVAWARLEPRWAERLCHHPKASVPIRRFGAGDARSGECKTHLFALL